MSPLTLYKASAGSGKTHALTLGYIGLLLKAPEAHRHILAVTFTNKAAAEMKHRILSILSSLSKADPSGDKQTLGKLSKDTGLDCASIVTKSGKLLDAILNDYSWFSVGTIDKFFQSVIRSFTREIGIQPGYNLELDYQGVLEQAIDQLFIDLADQLELKRWMIRYAEERMEDSRSWNFKEELVDLGLQLFRESFQVLFSDNDLSVLDKENLDRYLQEMDQGEKDTRQQMVRVGEKALSGIALAGFEVEDFRGKGRSPAALFRLALEGSKVDFTEARLAALGQEEKWLVNRAPDEMASMTRRVLMPLLEELFKGQILLNTIQAIRRNFYTLGILGDIRTRVETCLKEQNLFLIADSSRFLRGIIGGNQVPFIYEKTGNRFHHIMLDEFQDTSVFQYENFRPLIANAMAAGKDNLVVGDVKQSIYRWRNSDWTILAAGLETDFSHLGCSAVSLDKNFRSRENIIRFNNTLFQLAPEKLAEMIKQELTSGSFDRKEAEMAVDAFRKAYADAVQQIPPGSKDSGGGVRMELLAEEGQGSFRKQVLERLPDWIETIQASGIEPGQIAILVRSRKDGIQVAERLLQHSRQTGDYDRFRLISSDSLLLGQNDAVKILVAALHHLVNPDDEQNNALLKYLCYISESREAELPDTLFDVSVTPERFLPREFSLRAGSLRRLPLFELVEVLVGLFGLDRRADELPYVQAFQELVIETQRRGYQGIDGFLDLWKKAGPVRGIQVAESANAIRILTIHRAKGLQFKAVLVPFCDWEITTEHRKSNQIWCRTLNTPFGRIPTVPVRFGIGMKHTLFSSFYYEERMKGYLDNLNLLYVALTRATDVLWIGVPQADQKGMKTVGDLLLEIREKEPILQPALRPLVTYMDQGTISVGEIPLQKQQDASQPEWNLERYRTLPGSRIPRLRTGSDDYFADQEGVFRTERLFGSMMHKVFAKLETAKDLCPVLRRFRKEGLLTETDQEELRDQIDRLISGPLVKSWFSEKEGRTIMNERTILCGNGIAIRPDRVLVDREGVTVIDFKFGQMEEERHRAQVALYMERLHFIGYRTVQGYLWYVMQGKIIEIGKP
jgi:ATP-dependent exoDNAse (exonuclease V) beta subunit